MIIIDIITLLIFVAIITIIVQELVIPFCKGTPLFPSFKKSEIQAKISEKEKELENVVTEINLKKVEDKLNSLKDKLK